MHPVKDDQPSIGFNAAYLDLPNEQQLLFTPSSAVNKMDNEHIGKKQE